MNNPNYTYSIFTKQISISETFKDLGLLVDNRLKFKDHIASVCTCCLRLIGIIFKMFHSNDESLYIKFYSTYVLPKIYYATSLYLYGYKGSIRDIERIQRTFTRRLYVPCNNGLFLQNMNLRNLYLFSKFSPFPKFIHQIDRLHLLSTRDLVAFLAVFARLINNIN